jgi:hypothetical protein
MAYREVTMIEITEVLRQWLGGGHRKQIARRLGLDPKTVRRYRRAAATCGLGPGMPVGALTEERLTAIVTALRRTPARAYGPDGAPGDAVALDTGWMTLLAPDAHGRRRRFRAWIFTPHLSRYRFVYPCFGETTAGAIEACEAAWAFYGGVFRVVIPDNTKAIITTADPLQPRLAVAFLEYAQARGFVVDPARVRRPQDKARVERTVPFVRDDCFAGETLASLAHARIRGLVWAREEAGVRRHRRTPRRPREPFETVEQPALLPAPTTPYDVPLWCTPKVARDHHAQVAKALDSRPTKSIGRHLRARADRTIGALLRRRARREGPSSPAPGRARHGCRRSPGGEDRLRPPRRNGTPARRCRARSRDRRLRRRVPRGAPAVDPHATGLRAARPRAALRRGARRRDLCPRARRRADRRHPPQAHARARDAAAADRIGHGAARGRYTLPPRRP